MAVHIKDIDQTQADFQTGTLIDVEADAGDFLRLADSDVLSFNGSTSYAHINNQWNYPITIEYWVYFNTSGSYVPFCSGFDYDTDLGILTKVDFSAGQAKIFLGSTALILSCTLSTGTWMHFAFVVDASGNIEVFKDGASLGTGTETNSGLHTNGTYLGSGNNVQSYLDGQISDLRIWSDVKTQTEINNNKDIRLSGSEAGLIAYYKLDEGSGNTATDSAGTNDGIIYNSSWTIRSDWREENGNRLSPQLDLSAVGMVESSLVSWTQTLNGGTITIETRISTDNGATWSAWKPCTNGEAIPDLPYGTDVSTALLECRQSLSTSDPTVTPQLESLTLEINSQKVHAANLNMDISAGNKQISILRAISTALDVSTEYVLSGPWTKVSTPSNTWSRENGLE
jgi:hypothetical protein